MERVLIESEDEGRSVTISTDGPNAFDRAKELLAQHTTAAEKDAVRHVNLSMLIGDMPDVEVARDDGDIVTTETTRDVETVTSAEDVEKAGLGERLAQTARAVEELEPEWLTGEEIVEQTDPPGPGNWCYDTASGALATLVERGMLSRRGQGTAGDPWEYNLDYRGRELKFPVPRDGKLHRILRMLGDGQKSTTELSDELGFKVTSGDCGRLVDRGLVEKHEQGWGQDGRKAHQWSITKHGEAMLETMDAHTN